MKSLAHKLLALTFIIALFAGCASVTDAGLDTQTDQQSTVEIEQNTPQPEDPGFDGQEMDPILDKPK